MVPKRDRFVAALLLLMMGWSLSACSLTSTNRITPTEASKPDWFDIPLTDVQTGETFTINDFAGKVVLLETMAT